MTGENHVMPCTFTSLFHYVKLPSSGRLFCTGVTLLPCNRWSIPKWLSQERLEMLLGGFRASVLPHAIAESRIVCPSEVRLCNPPTTETETVRRQHDNRLSFTALKTLLPPSD